MAGAAAGGKPPAVTIAGLGILAAILALLAGLRVATLKKTLLAIALLEIPIQFDIYLGHDEQLTEIGTVSGINLSVMTVVLVALYALWGAELAAGAARISREAARAALPTAVFVALVTLSVVIASDTLLAVFEIVILVQAVLLFWYLLHHVTTSRELLFVIAVLMAGVVAQSLIVIGLRLLGSDVVVGPVKADIDGTRINGTLGSPNVLGSYLTLMLPAALGLSLSSASSALRRLGGAAFGLGTAALVLSFSRGAWVGFTLSIALMLVVAWRRRWLVGVMPALIGLAGVLLTAVFQDEIVLRVRDYNNLAAQSRLPLMDFAWRMIRDAPLTGVGANNFSTALRDYVTIDNSRDWVFTVHNKYLLVWAESGILALAAFLWTLGAALARGWRRASSVDPLLAPPALGLAVGLLGSMIHMTVEIYHGRPQVQLLWLVLALLLVLPRLSDPPADRTMHTPDQHAARG